MIPFLALPAACATQFFIRSTAGRAIVVLAGAWSLFATWALFVAGDTFPLSWLRNPLFDYSLPSLRDNVIASNSGLFLGLTGWTTLLPLAVLVLLLAVWPWLRRPRELQRARTREQAHAI